MKTKLAAAREPHGASKQNNYQSVQKKQSQSGMIDQRPAASANAVRQNMMDDSVQTAQLKERIAKLQAVGAQAIQKAEDKELLQGKFATVQRVEEEEPVQGKFATVQRVEEEEPVQGKFATVQRVEEEEPLQGKFATVQRVEEEEPVQGKFATAQRVEEEEPVQGKFATAQRVEEEEPVQRKFVNRSTAQLAEVTAVKSNDTGLPNQLKAGIESLSGMSMDHVKVHYNSDRPAQLNAHAYAQGNDIHVAPGQEQHVPHEAWHVVQQAQGRVNPTMQMKQGVPVNDDAGLESEADVMGQKSLSHGVQLMSMPNSTSRANSTKVSVGQGKSSLQFKTEIQHQTSDFTYSLGATDKVGVAMRAWLDPHDPVIGSGTGTPQKELYDAVASKAKASMVRGHLLNHDLGGYGVAENLYPITSSANSKHKFYVENPVQQELGKAQNSTNKTQHDNNQGQGIFYQVIVGNAQTDTDNLVTKNVEFICTAKTLKNVGTSAVGEDDRVLFNTTIVSNTQGSKSTDRGLAHKTGDTSEAPEMKVNKKVVPKGWDHGGRSGTQDFLEKVEAKVINVGGADDKTTTLKGTSQSEAVMAAVKDTNATLKECNTAINEANSAVEFYIRWKYVSRSTVVSSECVTDGAEAVKNVIAKIQQFNLTKFDSDAAIIAAAENIMDAAELAIELANLLQKKSW